MKGTLGEIMGPLGEMEGLKVKCNKQSRLHALQVPRRDRLKGTWTIVSLNLRLESNKEEDEEARAIWTDPPRDDSINRISSGVRLCWELEEPNGPQGTSPVSPGSKASSGVPRS